MNSPDDRLRAAARSALDLFPPDGDLPPLQPPGSARHRRRRTGPAGSTRSGGTNRWRRWAAPVAAAAAVMAVIAALVVPHEIGSGASGSKPTTPPSAPPGLSQRRALDALVALSVAPATGAQYDRGGKLIWMLHAQELRVTARCVAAAGYHISEKTAPFSLAMYADNTEMPDLPRIARTHEFVPVGGAGGPINYAPGEEQAYMNCVQSTSAIYSPLLTADRTLLFNWMRTVTRVQTSREVRAALPALQACATRYGFPHNPYGSTAGPIETFGDFVAWVADNLDGAGSRGASQRVLNALERHWSSVFVTCATPIVGIWQRTLLKAQPNFLRLHARPLLQLDNLAWKYLVQRRH